MDLAQPAPPVYVSRLMSAGSAWRSLLLADVRRLHRTVMQAFPALDLPASPRQALGVLFRVDQARIAADLPDQMVLTVQSAVPPAWDRLAASMPGLSIEVQEAGPALARWVTAGTVLAVRMRVNAVTNRAGGGERGTRHRAVGDAAQAWAERHLVAAGMVPDQIQASPGPVLRGSQPGRPPIIVAATDVTGTVTVTEATAARTAILAGLGPGKAYGCGLIQIRPLA